jgi:hypothetical protein
MAVLVSQPLRLTFSLVLQSAKPESQLAMLQAPAVQAALPLAVPQG